MPVDSDIVRYRVSDVRLVMSELSRLTSKPFEDLSIDERYSIRYNIIVLVEALVSLCTHIAINDYGVTPRSYREAVVFVSERLGVKCVSDLEALVALRNLLVHRYWVIDDRKIYENIKGDFNCVEELLRKIVEKYAGQGSHEPSIP